MEVGGATPAILPAPGKPDLTIPALATLFRSLAELKIRELTDC
jgi:hypothetical protein